MRFLHVVFWRGRRRRAFIRHDLSTGPIFFDEDQSKHEWSLVLFGIGVAIGWK